MLGIAAVWHEFWPEQQHNHHYDVAQRQHDDATYGHHTLWLANDHLDHAATPPSPSSHHGKQLDDHAPHAYDDYDALEPFVVTQQRIDYDSAASELGFIRRQPAGH